MPLSLSHIPSLILSHDTHVPTVEVFNLKHHFVYVQLHYDPIFLVLVTQTG